nr:MAG TPA: hypothetical protein [Caudoviricetes sp.]
MCRQSHKRPSYKSLLSWFDAIIAHRVCPCQYP